MKSLILSILLLASPTVFADGGTSGVGPCGPDCQAQKAFENSIAVQVALHRLSQQGYERSVPDRDVNQFAGFMNCGKPSNDATWFACDRLYVFTRAFSNGRNSEEIRTVTAIVKLTLSGFEVQLVNGQ